MNFEKILVVLTAISGMFWLINKINNRPGVNPIIMKDPKGGLINEIIEYLGSLFIIFLVVLLIRTFAYEGYRIPSGSMKPTLIEGDFILVNKYKYGLKLPIIHKTILAGSTIQRGDIVIFWHAKSGKIYIKRVVGIPGDHIKYQDHNLYINNSLVKAVNLGFTIDDNIKTDLKKEFLGDLDHNIYINPKDHRSYPFQELTVSNNSYFVMGDNRTNSADSRVEGLIADKDILGKAGFILFSIDFSNWVVRFERIWKKVI